MKTHTQFRTVLGAAALALALVAPKALTAQDMGIEVGTRAPAAAVQSMDGVAMDLGTMYGEMPVVLEFWAT